MKKKKKETNKLPSIEELYKWAGFWQKIEIKSRVYEYFLCQAFHTIPNKTEAHMQTDWEMLSCRMFYDPSYLFR